MSKTILIAGASGLVGGRLLSNLKSSENHLVLLGRNKIASEKNINQIITDFDNIENLENNLNIDEVYISIGYKLTLFELLYLKKSKREEFRKVDFEYIKNIAQFAKRCGAKSIGLISAVGANSKSFNTYLNVKGHIENEVSSMGFNKVVIGQPGHLLGLRSNEKIPFNVMIFEVITNLFGYLMFGPIEKYRNIDANKVAKGIINKMNESIDGIHYLNFSNFKKL